MEITKLQEMTPKEMATGVNVRFIHSSSMTVAYWDMDAHASIPEHSHPHEQIVNVLEGEIWLSVGGESQKLGMGSVVVIPPNVPHGGEAVVNSRLLDVFHPVREDYR
jgi:quercetin dioxygenase-like cupin family protein